jgi:MFS family permease
MIVGTQWLTGWGGLRPKQQMVMTGLFGVALGILLLAIFGNIPMAVAATVAMGFGVALVIVPAQALIQELTPVEMLGRVSSSLMCVLALVQIAALVLSGWVAQTSGIRNSYFVTSVLLLVVACLGYRRANGAGAAIAENGKGAGL